MTSRKTPTPTPDADRSGLIRQLLRELRGWRPTLARLRQLVRSMVTSFLVLSGTLWLMPGVNVNGVVAMLWLVVLVAVVGALLRPLLLALATVLGGLGALLVGASVQTIVMYVALRLDPASHLSGLPAAFAAAWIAVALAAVVNWFADAGTDDAFTAEALRLMGRVRRVRARSGLAPAGRGEPGLVVVQLDGVPTPLLRWAVQAGNLPNIGRWLRSRSHTLTSWHTGLPATTPAGQAGILHGDARSVPAFRWYEKDAERLIVTNRPRDAAVVERRLSDGNGLLRDGGVSISNVFSGDAPITLFTISRAALPGRRTRGYAAFMTSPYGFTRAIVLGFGRMLKEVHQARIQRRRDIRPRVGRAGAFLALRPLTALLRDLNVTLIAEQMARGAPVIFCDFVDYDEVAHHAGPARPEALEALTELDQMLGMLQRLAVEADRDYHLVVLSDHGQSQGATFQQRYGETLTQLVGRLTGTLATPEPAPEPAEGLPAPDRAVPVAHTDQAEPAPVTRPAQVDQPAPGTTTDRPVDADADRAAVGSAPPLRAARPRRPRHRPVGHRLGDGLWTGRADREQPPRAAAATGAVETWGPVNTLLTEIAGQPGAGAAATRAAMRSRTTDRQVTLGPAGAETRTAARPETDSVVVASGNLAMIYLPHRPGQVDRAGIEAAHPGLVAGLAAHPGIGLVVVADGERGPVAVGHRGEHRLRDGVVTGEDPLKGYGPRARGDLLRHQEVDHVGDLVLISAIDPGTDEVAAFEELVGSHGGLGGWQTDAVLLHPIGWRIDEPELVGPDSVHRQLVGWLEQLGLRERSVPAAGLREADQLGDEQHHDHRDEDALPRFREDRAAEDADTGVHR
ncbi:alkaline phosphatase family protein [Polymorphospora sp. A560]